MPGLDELLSPDSINTKPPGIAPLFPQVGPNSLVKLGRQSRPLNPDETASIDQTFKGNLNPSHLRLAYDGPAEYTGLRGWTTKATNPVMFFAPDKMGGNTPDALKHEATHVWQDYAREPADSHKRSYNYASEIAAGSPFEKMGTEQQAEMVNDSMLQGLRAVQSRPAPSRPNEGAFLDSIRDRFGIPADDLHQIAESHKPGSISDINLTNVNGNSSKFLRSTVDIAEKRLGGSGLGSLAPATR